MNSDSSAAGGAAALGVGLFVVIFYVVIIAFSLYINYKIVSKAGYPGWYFLLGLIPCAGIVFLIMFAFQEWPIERELAQWRATGGGGAYPRYGQQQYPPQDPPPAAPPWDPPSAQG